MNSGDEGHAKLTVVRERIRPVVQRRIEVDDNTLFPLLVSMTKLRPRLVGRVLRRNWFHDQERLRNDSQSFDWHRPVFALTEEHGQIRKRWTACQAVA